MQSLNNQHERQFKFPLTPFKKVWHKLEGLLEHHDHNGIGAVVVCGRCDKILGRGSSGTVKRYLQEGVGELAKKEFHPRHAKESEKHFMKRITAEFCIASTLRHENIIRTFDLDLNSRPPSMVMEYLPHDLLQLLQENGRKIDLATLDCYLAQLIRGVAYLHDSGIAHRDLKLENLMISLEGCLKIIDFGSAQVIRTPLSPPQLCCNGPHGSDPYMPAEVWLPYPYDALKADIWAVGIIAIAMRDRQFPWSIAKSDNPGFLKWCTFQTGHQGEEAEIRRWLLGSFGGGVDSFWELIKGTLRIEAKDRWDITQVLKSEWSSSVDACGGGKKGTRCNHSFFN